MCNTNISLGPRNASFAVHVDVDNLWIYESEYGLPISDYQDLIYTQALPDMLAIFDKFNIKATFFIIGNELNRQTCVDFLLRAIHEGHKIGNHSYSHREDFGKLELEKKKLEIIKTDLIISDKLKTKSIGFRSPGYWIDTDIAKTLQELGYLYDSSVLPGPGGLLMKLYMHLMGRKNSKKSFGPLSSLLSSRMPYFLEKCNDRSLIEIPIATMPYSRLPIHSTFSYLFGIEYVVSSIKFLKKMNNHHVYLFHAIDALENPLSNIKKNPILPLNIKHEERLRYIFKICDLISGSTMLTEDIFI